MTAISEHFTASEGGELELQAVGRVVWRRKWWAIGPAVLAAIIATIAVNMLTPRYKSEARILYDGRENVFMRPQAEHSISERNAADPEALTSQVQLVLSRQLALDVIDRLKLARLPEFDPLIKGLSPLKRILVLLGISRDPERMTTEERVLDAYYEKISAYQIEKSRVIAVEFQAYEPELAAKVVNTIAEGYLALQQQAKQEEMRASGQWLSSEIDKLRRKVAEAEARAEEFRARSNLFVGTNNTTLSNQQLGEFSTQLSNARAQKSDAETRARLIRNMLSRGEPIEASDIVNSELVRRLSEQRVALRAQLAEQYSTLLDAHPRIKELKAQLADLDRQIRAEAEKLVRTLENDAKIAGARVEALSANLDTLKRQAATTNEDDVHLRALEREARAQRELLESYLAKYREATARENIANAPPDARIISRGIVSNTPFFPKKLPIVLIATIATLVVSASFIATSAVLGANNQPYASAWQNSAGPGQAPVPQSPPAAPLAGPVLTPQVAPALVPVAGEPAVPDDPPEHPPNALFTSIDDLVDRLQAGRGGRSVAFFGLGSDASAPLAAVTVARVLAREWLVVLVRLGSDPPNMPTLAFDPSAPGVTDLVNGNASFGEVITRDRLSRMHVVPHGRAAMEVGDVLGALRYATMVDALAHTYDHVIIDMGRIDEIPLDKAAAHAPRGVLVVANPDAPEAIATRSRLEAAGYGDLVVLVKSPLVSPQPEAA
jgi:uncharacterized protein involved in exopolysaccharide biosynthesis